MEAKRTPGPWKVRPMNTVESNFGFCLYKESEEAKNDGREIAVFWQHYDRDSAGHKIGYEIDRANAEFVVRACNAHEELVTVAKGCLGYLQALPYTQRPDDAWFKPLIAALAKAEGKKA